MATSMLNRKPDEATSQCQRCGGFLVSYHCLDLENSWGDRWCQTLRCVQCGELVDPIILQNRRRSLSRRRPSRASGAPHASASIR